MKKHRLYNIFDQVPVTYYQKGTKSNLLQKIWHSKKIELAKKIINQAKFKNCLDIGCASGYMISEISKLYPSSNFYGVDVYDKAIDYAKKRYPNINFKAAAAEKLPYHDNYFDLIICYETVEHVEDPLLSLKQIKRVLSKNGWAIITMDSGSLLFRIVWFFWENSKGRVWKGAHLHPFSHNELEKIIRKSGLKIQQKLFSHWGMEVTFVVSK